MKKKRLTIGFGLGKASDIDSVREAVSQTADIIPNEDLILSGVSEKNNAHLSATVPVASERRFVYEMAWRLADAAKVVVRPALGAFYVGVNKEDE